MPKIIDVLTEGMEGGYDIVDGVVRIRFTVTYIVEGDAPTDAYDYILTETPGLPIVGTLLGGAICRSRRAVPTSSTALLWEVPCNFSSHLGKRDTDAALDEEERTKPMEQKKPRYNWTTELWEVPLLYDRIFLDADDEPLPMVGPSFQQIEVSGFEPIANFVIERYELQPFDPNIIWEYVGKVNSLPFFGFPRFTVLCAGLESEEEAHTDPGNVLDPTPKVYYRIRYSFKIRKNKVRRDVQQFGENREAGWQEVIPVVGTQEFRETGPSAYRIWKLVASVDRYYTKEEAEAKGDPDLEDMPHPEGRETEVYLYPNHPTAGGFPGSRLPIVIDPLGFPKTDPPPFYRWINRYDEVDFNQLDLDPSGSGAEAAAMWANIINLSIKAGSPPAHTNHLIDRMTSKIHVTQAQKLLADLES